MKTFLKIAGIVVLCVILVVIATAALMPWMDRWGASNDEIAASFSGDELVPAPNIIYTRALSIKASPAEIYPWIVQMGAGKGGMYSYSWFETNILRCELINADRIHPEWQDLKAGDKVHMCPGDWGPPAYTVAALDPGKAVVIGHPEEGSWVDVWQFILAPEADGTTRLILRSRDTKSGLMWDLFRPGEFIMVRGMLLGIKERAEQLARDGGIELALEVTPTPEIFIPLDKAIPDYGLTLDGVHLAISGASLSGSFPAGCSGQAPACASARDGYKMLSVTLAPRDLPAGDMLHYKSLPDVSVATEGGELAPCTLRRYDNASHALTLGCEVPAGAAAFGLHWADLAEIPLNVSE